MNNINNSARKDLKIYMKDFAIELGLAADASKLRECVAHFDTEMRRGLCGADASLRMLPTYLDPGAIADAAPAGRVVAIDAGGTNLRVALADIGEGGAFDILHHETHPIPGFKQEVDAREFFDRIAALLAPVVAKSDRIGFCFSNPAVMLPDGDARILTFTKEVKVSGAGGIVIGAALREALRSRGLPSEKRVAVLNDTVAAQLGALAGADDREKYGAFVGFILGTGVNACYAESNENIHKDALLREKPGATIINTEAGGYDGFPETEADRRIIGATADPERHRFEKMSSGAYQCDNLLEWIRFAANRGVFSEAFALRLRGLKQIPVGEADGFCAAPRNGGVLAKLCPNAADMAKLRRLIEAFFDRIAFMLAVMLTAILARARDAARDDTLPVCISAEGGAFRNEKLLRERLDLHMTGCARAQFGLSYRFTHVEHATIRGAALAALAAPAG
jgi:hexokinase